MVDHLNNHVNSPDECVEAAAVKMLQKVIEYQGFIKSDSACIAHFLDPRVPGRDYMELVKQKLTEPRYQVCSPSENIPVPVETNIVWKALLNAQGI